MVAAAVESVYEGPDGVRAVSDLLSVDELALALNGERHIDVEDLRSNTLFGRGYEEDSDQIRWLFSVLSSLDHADLKRFCVFVTGSSVAPPFGFGALNPKFTVARVKSPEAAERLPSASTCFSLLKLPCYTTEDELRSKLLTAIREGGGFAFS